MASKFALVIANTEYQDASFAKLTAPGKDAEEFAQVLRDPALAAFDDVQVSLNEEESKIRRAIARFFVNRKRDDLLLLYFSGHGLRNEQGQLFLAANDTEISILEATGIPADFVTHAMNNSRSQRQLLILDCCNSGAFAHGSKSASGIGKSMGIATAFEGSGFGRVVLTATDATQYAWEGDKVIGDTQKSVFTHFLIEGLKGNADRDGDGRIHVDELYDYAYEQVVGRTPKQTPGKWSYKQQGDIVLRENLKPRDVKPVAIPSDILYYLDHPSSGVRSTGVEELIRLLDGKHLGLSRAAEDKLREIAANDDSLTLRKTASEVLSARGLKLDQSLPAELLTQKPVQKEAAPSSKSSSRREFSSPLATGVKDKAPPPTLFDRKLSIPTLDKLLLGRILGLVFLVFFLGWAGKALMDKWTTFNSAPPIPTNTSSATAEPTSQPARTDTPSPTKTSVPATPTLGIGSTMTGNDGMTLLYVPAGEFTIREGDDIVQVYLDAFWIDKTEVTNKMYSLCVSADACQPPKDTKSDNRSSYYGNSEYENYPVIFVDWNLANNYCEWAGRRLPTDAEWEKAARGSNGGAYPWGNEFDSTLLNFCDKNCLSDWADKSVDDGYADTAPVGSYPDGASPYGALDMAGNVWEWVADWYDEAYFANLPTSNPLGPDSGQDRVIRGGGLTDDEFIVRADVRGSTDPSNAAPTGGFRCARSTTP